jgi:hypothetical protein
MQPDRPSDSTPLVGLIFITAILVITFLLVARPGQDSLAYTRPSAEGLTILYLVDASKIPADSYRQPDVLRRDLSSTIQVIDNGQAAAASLEDEALEALDVLIVDQSALTFINPEDITDAYDASVVVFGLSIPVTELSRLVDDTRLTFDNFAANPYSGDFYIYTQRSSNGYGRGQNDLITPRDFEIFNAVLSLRGSERRDPGSL